MVAEERSIKFIYRTESTRSAEWEGNVCVSKQKNGKKTSCVEMRVRITEISTGIL